MVVLVIVFLWWAHQGCREFRLVLVVVEAVAVQLLGVISRLVMGQMAVMVAMALSLSACAQRHPLKNGKPDICQSSDARCWIESPDDFSYPC